MQKALVLATALFCAALACSPAEAQSTAFTYQGSLDDAGAPTSGLHDFRFRLFDAASGGVQIGSLLCVDNVSVTAGVFTAQLDFGQQFASTAPRHLEIEVRRDTGLTCANSAGFIVLGPRQQLTATPIASHANAAFSLDAADGAPTSAVFVDTGGKVGIGTTSPAKLLHLQGADPAMVLQDTATPSNQGGYISFWNSTPVETGWLGYGIPGNPLFSLRNARAGGDIELWAGGERLRVTSTGNVGIGTSTPAAALEVRGDIRLGTSGQLRATGGEENLRLLRGTVDANGTIIAGTGFSIQTIGPKVYKITFSTSFNGLPSVTASSDIETQPANVFVTTPSYIQVVVSGAQASFCFCAIGPR